MSSGTNINKKEVQIDIRQLESEKSLGNNYADDSVQSPATLSAGAVERFWIVEAAAWTLALAALLSIIGMLLKFENEPSPDSLVPRWHLNIAGRRMEYQLHLTINSLIALLSTVFKIALFIPIGACLAQLKWTWFAEGNKLSDFQLIDKAKGVWGSIVLLWTFRGRRLASLGAFLTLSALALDFTLQALITYGPEPRPLQNLNTLVARRSNFSALDAAPWQSNTLVINDDEAPMNAAIYNGIFGTKVQPDIVPSCQTGNCTWDPYMTIGICSRCEDVTSELQESSCSTYTRQTYDLDNNINGTEQVSYCNYTMFDTLDMSTGGPSWSDYDVPVLRMARNKSNTLDGILTPITSLSMLSANWTQFFARNATKPTLTATQCLLTFCAKKYHGEVVNGVFTEQLVDTFVNKTASISVSDGIDDDGVPASSWVDYYINPPASFYQDKDNKTAEFYVGYASTNTLWILTGQSMWTGTANLSRGSQLSSDNDLIRHVTKLNSTGIQQMMDNIANSMTNVMRLSTPSLGSLDRDASGTALQMVSIVHVQWLWIILPVAMLALALGFFVATAINSARSNLTLWKGNSLASFTHGLTGDGRVQFLEANRVKDVDKIAGDIRVRWVPTEKGARLVQI